MPNPDAIQSVFELTDREVWIVTACNADRRGGLTATWVSQASLDRSAPTVAIGIAPNHATCELIQGSRAFGLHLLRADQAPLALRFALGSSRERDKFEDVDVEEGESGSPLLKDCLARLDCRVFCEFEMGDRVYFWADVLAGERRSDAPTLRERALMASANATELAALKQNMNEDIALQRQRQAAWRAAQSQAT